MRGCVRLRFSRGGEQAADPGLIIDPAFVPDPADARVRRNGRETIVSFADEDCTVTAGDLITCASVLGTAAPIRSVRLSRKTVFRFRKGPDVHMTTIQTVDGPKTASDDLEKYADRQAFGFEITFVPDPEEHIYGLGLHEEDFFDYRGKTQYLIPANRKIPVPVILSSRKCAYLFNHGCAMVFRDGPGGTRASGECADELDLFILFGETFDDVLRGIRRLTGRASMLPRWALGYWQSKEHYGSSAELAGIVRGYRERRIPLDCIVQDWLYWPEGQWGQKSYDPSRYPDPDGFIGALHRMGAKLMISVWPNMAACPDRDELSRTGGLLADGSTYDAFDPQAGRTYWRQASAGLFRHDTDAFWCDSTEPYADIEWGGTVRRSPGQRYRLLRGHFGKYIDPARTNLYALYHSKNITEGQTRERPGRRPVHLTRSGYAGQQRYGAVVWTGDVSAKWAVLRSNITNMLQFSMTGHPYVTFDIGGFFAGSLECYRRRTGHADLPAPWFWDGDYEDGVNDKGYCELYVRWLQAGAFMPVFRSHGSDTPREAWQFAGQGQEFYRAIVRTIRLRYELMPYLYSLAAAVHADGDSFLRPLFFRFPEDPRTYAISDQYLFGPSIMVCPVTEAMYYGPKSVPADRPSKTRRVYLPGSTGWYDFWTGAHYPGGTEIEADAPLDRIPAFVPEGSIIPMSGGSRTNADACGPVHLAVYPGRDCVFRYYDDAGDGPFDTDAFTEFRWDDNERKIVCSAPCPPVAITPPHAAST